MEKWSRGSSLVRKRCWEAHTMLALTWPPAQPLSLPHHSHEPKAMPDPVAAVGLILRLAAQHPGSLCPPCKASVRWH